MSAKTETAPAPLMKQKQIEDHFQISRWMVARWVEDGCPVRRLPSGHKRFNLAAVEEWLDRQAAANAA